MHLLQLQLMDSKLTIPFDRKIRTTKNAVLKIEIPPHYTNKRANNRFAISKVQEEDIPPKWLVKYT